MLDVARNAANKIAVALGADAAAVTDGVELFTHRRRRQPDRGGRRSSVAWARGHGSSTAPIAPSGAGRVLGYPLAVIYKYFDDQGNYLAAIITYYAFIAIFPLLLLGSSILGFFLAGQPGRSSRTCSTRRSPSSRSSATSSAGPRASRARPPSIVIGGLVALYGALGLGQALQNALNIAWSVPRNSRPNPILLRLKSLVPAADRRRRRARASRCSRRWPPTPRCSARRSSSYSWPITLLTRRRQHAACSPLLFRVGAARSHSLWRGSVPGAVTASLLWIGLQTLGTVYVTNVVTETIGMNQTFALVLGLIGLI